MTQYLPFIQTSYMTLTDFNELNKSINLIDFHIMVELSKNKELYDKYRIAIGPELDALEAATKALTKRLNAVFNSVDTGNG